MISPDNDVRTIFEGGSDSSLDVAIEKRTNRIKIVGKNAKGEINFKILAAGDISVIAKD